MRLVRKCPLPLINLHGKTEILRSAVDVAKIPKNVFILILVVLLTKLIGIVNV